MLEYQKRGVTCSEEWADSFQTFIEDMGPCPLEFELDRIDNTKGYSKENCRWTSRLVNAFNKNKRPRISKDGLPQGVHKYKKTNKFRAQICINHISCHLGIHDTVEKALAEYNKVALEWYGFLPNQ